MAVYIVVIIILYISSFVNYGKIKKHIYWLFVTALAILSGIRYFVGTDFGIQMNYYNWTLNGTTKSWLEPGFRIYILFIDKVFGNFQWFIFIASIFVIFSFGYYIYKNLPERNWFFSLALFVVSTIYFATFNLERQYIAIALLLYGYENLKKKKYIKTIMFTGIAISFHTSSVVFIIAYILYFLIIRFKSTKKLYKIINIVLIASIIGGIIDIRSVFFTIGRFFIPSEYIGYLATNFFHEKNWLALLKMIVPFAVWIYIYYFFPEEKKEKFKEYLPLFTPWVAIDTLFAGVNVLLRVGMYFEWVLLIIYPLFINGMKKKINRMLFKNLFLIIYTLLTVYSIFLQGGHGVVPYQTFF